MADVLLNSVKERFPSTHTVLLDNLEAIISSLRENSRLASVLDLTEPRPSLYNSYIAFAVAIYVAKFKQLYESIVNNLNHCHYLIYAQSGRSILENTATLRYYSRHKDLHAVRQALSTGSVPTSTLNTAIQTVDKLIRGNRFTWQAFIERRFSELEDAPEDPKLKQEHVQDCLRHWYKDNPSMKGLYNILSDLVHPNLGSNLTVIRAWDGKLTACGEKGEEMIMFVIAPTLAGIVGAYRVAQESFLTLEATKIVE